MRVLMYTSVFLPSYGGLEQMVNMVALELVGAGHDVVVATNTPTDSPTADDSAPYRVVRQPNMRWMLQAATSSDVCVTANLPLRATPFMLRFRNRTAVMHQGFYWPRGHLSAKAAAVKTLMRTVALNIACSEAVAKELPANTIVIPNCYSHDVFHPRQHIAQDLDIAFVGRLVSDKGAHHLVDALARLSPPHRSTTLTIVGSGPELGALQRQAEALGIRDRISFPGPMGGTSLSETMARHKIIVVPSVVEEGFGIVALEGIASGCVALGSDAGGLPEAIGPCGLVVPRRNADELARGIERLLSDDGLRASLRAKTPPHLARHTRAAVGQEYVRALENLAKRQCRA